MNNFTKEEKTAVLRLLYDTMTADNIIRDKEVAYMKEVAESFGLTTDYKPEALSLTSEQAMDIIRQLSNEQKQEAVRLMGKMIVADGEIHYNEVKLYNAVCKACGIAGDMNDGNVQLQ